MVARFPSLNLCDPLVKIQEREPQVFTGKSLRLKKVSRKVRGPLRSYFCRRSDVCLVWGDSTNALTATGQGRAFC